MKNARKWSKALLLGMFALGLTFAVVPEAHAKAPYKVGKVNKIKQVGAAPLGDPTSTTTAFGILVHERSFTSEPTAIVLASYAPKYWSAEQRKAWIALEEPKVKDFAAKFSASFTELLGKKPVEAVVRKLDPAQSFAEAGVSEGAFLKTNIDRVGASPDFIKGLIAKAGAEQFLLIETFPLVSPNMVGTSAAGRIELTFTLYTKDGRAVQWVSVTDFADVKGVKSDDAAALAPVYDLAMAAIPDAIKKLYAIK